MNMKDGMVMLVCWDLVMLWPTLFIPLFPKGMEVLQYDSFDLTFTDEYSLVLGTFSNFAAERVADLSSHLQFLYIFIVEL